jgi:hypothetical protein
MQVRKHWTLTPHVGVDPYDGGVSYKLVLILCAITNYMPGNLF